MHRLNTRAITALLALAAPVLLLAGKGGGTAKSTCILGTDLEGGLPSGWDVGAQVEQQDALGNGLGTFVDAWRVATSAEASANGWFPVPDRPTGNRFVMANDDAAPCNCDMTDATLTSPAFDLSGAQHSALRFRAFLSNVFGGGNGSVEASSDGVNWSSVASIGAVPNTWQWCQADLSAFDGQSAVRIRFRWSDNGNWSGGLAIDDICVAERDPHDLVILDAFLADAEPTAFDGTRRTLAYTQLPLEQTSPSVIKAVVLNAGTLVALDLTCTVDITENGSPSAQLSTTSSVLGAGTMDTLLLTGWQAAGTGRVEATFTITALSADDSPSDNTVVRTMWITGPGFDDGNNAMALDDSLVTGSIANDGNDYAVAVRYEITRTGSAAHAVSFLPGASSEANGRIVGKVLDAQFNLLAESDEHVLTQVEIDDAQTQGRMVYLTFDTPLALDPDADVFAVIEHNSDSGAVSVALANGTTHGAALFYDGPGVQWDYLLNVPVVRLHLSDPEVGVAELVRTKERLELAPVPADEATWLRVPAEEATGATWTLHSTEGRVVAQGRCTGRSTRIATAQLPAGLYVLVVRSGGGSRAGRLVVAH